MFERYSEESRRALLFARLEAGRAGSGTIETEHLLLGLLREAEGTLARFLTPAQIAEARKKAEARKPEQGRAPGAVDLPLSTEAQRALAHGAHQATDNQGSRIEAGHLLLGLLQEENCTAARILTQCGIDSAAVRAAAMQNHQGG
jgi:ATP-dependent Clp protease ATP-binding subunit ClpC